MMAETHMSATTDTPAWVANTAAGTSTTTDAPAWVASPLDIESGNTTNAAITTTGNDYGVLTSPSTMIDLPPEPELKGGLLKPLPETTILERIAAVVACAAVGTSLAAIIIEQSAIVIVGGVLSAILGPYAYLQQTQLTDIKALKETEAAVRREVDKLAVQNERLAKSVVNLTDSVTNLKNVEEALEVLTNTQGQSVEAFRSQLDDNKQILSKMQSNLKASILQNLLSIILRCDKNGDLIISDDEIDSVAKRIDSMAQVTVDQERFKEAISGKSIQDIMEIMKNVLRDDVPPDERIFAISQ